MKAWFLKFHRWLALTFGLPLFVIFFTGLILSFEPIVVNASSVKGTLTTQKINIIFDKFDPNNKANSLSYRSYDRVLTLSGVGNDGETEIDVDYLEEPAIDALLPDIFYYSRRIHESFLLDLDWLVTTSTFIMLGLIILGLLMGWPRFANTLEGWHKGAAFGLLPLVIISPLTGLFMVYGVTFSDPPPALKRGEMTLKEAVMTVSNAYDLSNLIWIRQRGGRYLARISDGGEFRVFTVLPNKALYPTNRNWPRLIHEGNWSAYLAGSLNIIVSIGFIIMLVTGTIIWTRRNITIQNNRRKKGRKMKQ